MKDKAQINSYRDLIVWQKSLEASIKVYKLTEGFPKEEVFGLTSQMRRASVSIPSNIAEGRGRGTKKDFVQFLRIALGSAGELGTQLEIAKRLPQTSHLQYSDLSNLLMEVIKMLNGMIRKLTANS